MDSKEFRFELKVDEHTLKGYKENPKDLAKLIDKEVIKELQDFVFDNLKDKDGSPEVAEIETKHFKYVEADRKGSFRLQFLIDRRFCCSDTDSCSADYIDFQFQVEDGMLQAKGGYFDWTLSN